MKYFLLIVEGGSFLSNTAEESKRMASINGQIKMEPVTHQDVVQALDCVQQSSSVAPELYRKWEKEFGSSTKSYTEK